MSGTSFDRRDFIAGAGAVAAVAFLPVALATPAPAVGDAVPRATLADWHVDDMWGVYPRPSEPIGYGRPHGDGELVAAVAAADRQFLCA
jgi:TAT (twin-arginine translocation) pathway-exported protein